MAKYLSNAFSINMLNGNRTVEFVKVRPEDVTAELLAGDFTSAIGHTDTAAVVSNIIGIKVEPNRINLKVDEGDVLFVAQYAGPRLPEGSTTLPEGGKITFYRVKVIGDAI